MPRPFGTSSSKSNRSKRDGLAAKRLLALMIIFALNEDEILKRRIRSPPVIVLRLGGLCTVFIDTRSIVTFGPTILFDLQLPMPRPESSPLPMCTDRSPLVTEQERGYWC